MKLAKASKDEAEELLRWLQARENTKHENAAGRPPAFNRVIMGYLLLMENCTDQAKDYLDWNPGQSPADIARLERILAAVKAYPYLPAGLAALIEDMEKQDTK